MKKTIIILLTVALFVCGFSLFAQDNQEEKVTVTPYGYIKMDAVYETGQSSHGNFAIWAADPGESDGLWHLTANQTRLGFAVKGFSFGKFNVSGNLEVDFYGGNAENKAYNYMRHAFMKVTNGKFAVIAGQTWDIISPLNPDTLNYPVLWGAGNMGYRRPQLRVETYFTANKSTFTLQAGIFRTIAADYDGDGIEDGKAADFPTIQARLAGKFSLGGAAYLQLGISGHYGKSSGVVEYTSDSINVDFLWQVSSQFKLVAEFTTGKNLGTFLGGIAQSVSGGMEVETKLFFVNAVYKISPKTSISVGYGMDDPDDDTLAVGGRAKNSTFFGNIQFSLSKSVKTGFEVSNWETEFKDLETQKTLRVQHSWTLSF